VETSDHFKNGATPKSQTSRILNKKIIMKNFNQKAIVIVALSLTLGFFGCGEKDKPESKTNSENVSNQTNEDQATVKFAVAEDEEINLSTNKAVIAETESKYLSSCDGAFSVVYQKLSLKTDKEYIEKLKYLYESTSQSELQSRRSSSLGINVPDYGTLDWDSKKDKFRSVYKKYKNEVDFSLTYNEHIELIETYSRSEDVENALDAWIDCIKITNNIPYLQLEEQSDSSVIVFFQMMPNPYRGPNDKVKVKDITFSENLILIKGDIKGTKIKYNDRKTLTFKRKNLDKASVIIDLDEGFQIIPLKIPAIKKDIRCETKVITEMYEAKIEINAKTSTLIFTHNDGTTQELKFKEQNRSRQKWNFKAITKLKNTESVIYDCYIIGGITQFQKKGIILEPDGTLSIDCFLETGPKIMSGKFVIVYGLTKKICVENCPDEPYTCP
jgi:hypothetical protein